MTKKIESEKMPTTLELGIVYANIDEGEKEGEIVEVGFTKEMLLSKVTQRKQEMQICVCKVKFLNENGTHLLYKTVVSQSEKSKFINLLKEFKISFEDGKIDIASMVGEKVIATIKNNEKENGQIYSNIQFIRKVT